MCILRFVQVTDEMRTSAGGGLAEEGEHIEVIDLPMSELKQFMYDESKPKTPAMLFAFMWFQDEQRSKLWLFDTS